MDNSQRDIDPDIFEYLSKLPPDILEKMANEGLRAQEDQIYREVWLPLSWECLKSYFTSKDDFNSFIESFANPKDKEKFIYLSAFWKVMGDDYHGAYPQSIQLIAIFSIIEKLYENERFIDFYTWLRNYLNQLRVLAAHPPHEEEGAHGQTNNPPEAKAHPLGDSRRGVAHEPHNVGRPVPRPTEGTSAGRLAARDERHSLAAADRLPMEPAAEAVRR